MPAVATGTPVTVLIPKKAQRVAIVASASGGTIDVTYRITEAGDAIDVDWSVGQLADLTQGSTVVDFNITSFTVTGDGTFNYRVLY